MTPAQPALDGESSAQPTALAIVNARVWTGDPRRPWADALLLRGGLIEAVGSSAEVRKRSGAATKVIDAKGLVAQHARPSGALVAGATADVMLIDLPTGASGHNATNDAAIVLAIEAGRIVTHRDASGG
jgi:hypothetical protein